MSSSSPPKTDRSLVRALLAVAALCALGDPASAAAPQVAEQAPVSATELDLIDSRDRVELHPSDPLEIVGLGQRDNDFRAGLNAARRGHYEPAKIDVSDAYRRRIAQLESGATYSAPPARLDRRPAPPTPVIEPARKSPEPDGPEPYDTTWIGMTLAAVASVGIFMMRGRG